MEHKTKPGWKPWKPPPEKRDRWERWGLRGKTVWDWLNLLVVPVMLALVAGLFTTVQIIYQTGAESARERAIADQTAELQRFIEEFRVQEASLQAYLNLMATLLLQHHLREADVSSEVRAIAQAQTLTTLRKMDAQGKRTVVLFLDDALLLQQTSSLDARGPVIRLAGADLSEADLSKADLSEADLSEADLSEADLSKADLQRADLSKADLQRADLSGAVLQGADLSHAALQRANLCPATVPVSHPGVPPKEPTDPTNLADADLRAAALQEADLTSAVLQDANLTFADLTDANLSEASGWTEKQLRAAKSLEGATMPDGQILRSDDKPGGPAAGPTGPAGPTFEEWLKKEGRGESTMYQYPAYLSTPTTCR